MKSGLRCGALLCCVVIMASSCTLVFCRTLSEIISQDDRLSTFYEFAQQSEEAKTYLKSWSTTVFAPTNDAFLRYTGSHRSSTNLILYHIVKSSVTSASFPGPLSSELLGGLPIWVQKMYLDMSGGFKFEYFANNARILELDIKGSTLNGDEQVLHIIDEVLDPVIPFPDDINSRNPSAYRLLTNPDKYGITEQLSEFETCVQRSGKQMVVQGGEGSTFFIPFNGDFDNIWNEVNDKVIDAHVIPNKVLFSKAFPSYPQETLGFSDNLKAEISLSNESSVDQQSYKLVVQSNVRFGLPNFPTGVVTANVRRANIPVKNGVVYIIDNPLIISKKGVYQLLEQSRNLEGFFGLLQRSGDGLINPTQKYDVTIFAPSNEAFRTFDRTRTNLMSDQEAMLAMLKLHIVSGKFDSASIIQGNMDSVMTIDSTRKLHFSHNNKNITVTGGGVNASITTADIRAANGVIHVIDKILGIPYDTIFQKLESDRGLSTTFRLGQIKQYNVKFADKLKRFTYFVPHNEAWERIRTQRPSDYNKLFTPEYLHHLHNILNRHLVVNEALSLDNMLNRKTIQMVQGIFNVEQRERKYFVTWEGLSAEIMDPNVETANGYVHVIRGVMFVPKDLTNKASSDTRIASLIMLLLSTVMIKMIV